MERCHMYSQGKQCRAQATTHIYETDHKTYPRKYWEIKVCTQHAMWYTLNGRYIVKQLEEAK